MPSTVISSVGTVDYAAGSGVTVSQDVTFGSDVTVSGSLYSEQGAQFTGGMIEVSGSLYVSGSFQAADVVEVSGSLYVSGVFYASSELAGTATLSGGQATVLNSSVASNSMIFLTKQPTVSFVGGVVSVYTVVSGTSFDITSSAAADTDKVAWFIVNPS